MISLAALGNKMTVELMQTATTTMRPILMIAGSMSTAGTGLAVVCP